MYIKGIKSSIDFLLSIMLLIVMAPVFVLLTLIGITFMNGKPFFFQERTGLQGKIFNIVKFRTMKNGKVTSYGSFLRKFSLDELPQLFNVLIGQMSLIGPRPLLPEYLPLYNEIQKRRLLIKPGITGWAQVNGRNEISWEEKFELDVWYAENLSSMLDLKIAIKTIQHLNNIDIQPAKPFNIHHSKFIITE